MTVTDDDHRVSKENSRNIFQLACLVGTQTW